jgi:putative FmdB family regulatory protein
MPTYRYRCGKCGDEFEQWQSFKEDPVRTHDAGCGGEVLRVLTPAGIVLKGSGFYRNDSRSSSRERAGGADSKPKDGSGSEKPSSDSGGDSKGGDSKGGDSKGDEAKPAPAKTGDGSKSTAGAAKPT